MGIRFVFNMCGDRTQSGRNRRKKEEKENEGGRGGIDDLQWEITGKINVYVVVNSLRDLERDIEGIKSDSQ